MKDYVQRTIDDLQVEADLLREQILAIETVVRLLHDKREGDNPDRNAPVKAADEILQPLTLMADSKQDSLKHLDMAAALTEILRRRHNAGEKPASTRDIHDELEMREFNFGRTRVRNSRLWNIRRALRRIKGVKEYSNCTFAITK